MSEPGTYSKEWLESHTWEPSRALQHGDAVEDLDEFEGVVEALSMLDTTTKGEASQSRTSNTRPRSITGRDRLVSSRASDAGSVVSSSSPPWEPTRGSPRTWHQPHRSAESHERVQEEPEASGSISGGRDDASVLGAEAGRSHDKQLDERKGEGTSVAGYEENFGKIFTAEEALRQRVGDLEQKVNMLIAEEYYHRVSVPRGCFVVVLPGPGYACKLTEDLIESLQSRIGRVWPLCYFAPLVAKLASLATAILSWIPLPAPVYACNFPSEMDCRSPTYEIRKLKLSH